MGRIKAEVDKNRFCILNMDYWWNPKWMGKPNTRSAQEVQREQCKGKTILEMIEGGKNES